MSETEATEIKTELPRFCMTCRFWERDSLRTASEERVVWGYCTIGLPEKAIMPQRTTTDLTVCTAHAFAEKAAGT